MSTSTEPPAFESPDAADPTVTTEVDRGRKSLRASRPPVVSSGELLGHYQVIEEIGRGGMGTVYRGVDLRLGRQVALKLVAANARSYHARLLREAQALAQLSHPNVVPVYDVGTVHGAVFMAMELVTGQSLRQWLRAARRVVPEILRVFAAAGEGLAAAHAAGLVHRDFKPDNVLVGADGRVRVVDFGLARNAGSFELEPPSESSEPALSTESKDELSGQSGPLLLDSAVTQAGAVIGTPRYMSPEQLRGEPTDSRSDQYSFCVALYEALYETFPVVPEDAPPDAPARRGLPAHVRTALVRGLSRDPEQRFTSMTELVAELRKDVAARRVRIAVGLGAALALTVAIALGVAGSRRESPCAGSEERARSAWHASLRGKLEQALLASAHAGAGLTARRLLGQVDGFMRRWSDLRTQTCRATRVHGEQSELVMDRKMACLDERLDEVTALLGALHGTPSDEAVNQVLLELERLSSLSLCKDANALARLNQLPVRPDELAAVREVRADIRQLNALVAVGNVKEAGPAAQRLGERTARIHHAPTLAESSFAHVQALRMQGKLAEARSALDETLRLAAQVDNRTLLARAWALLVWQIGVEERRVPYGLELMRASEVSLLMARNEPDRLQLELDVGHTLGTLQLLHGDLASAEAHFQRALGQGDDRALTLRAAATLNCLGVVLTYLGKLDEARHRLAQVQAIFAKVVPGGHPYQADATLNRGLTFHWQGELERAEQDYRQAIALAGATVAEDHPKLALFRLYLGHALVDRGAFAEAEPELMAAHARFSQLLGEDSEFTRHVRVQLARMRLGRGDLAGARADIDAVRASLARTGAEGQLTPGYLHPSLVEGQIALAQGKLDDAERAIVAARDAMQPMYGADALPLAAAHIALAQLNLARKKPGEALALAHTGLSVLDAGHAAAHDPRRAEAVEAVARAELALDAHSAAGRAHALEAEAIRSALSGAHPRAALARAPQLVPGAPQPR